MTGEGRLMEPADILTSLTPVLENSQRLKGKTLLILSGPTREHLDPVRFIGNPSSGLMGRALAEEAVRQGASVRFVTGPVPEDHLPRHPDITLDPVTGAVEMLEHARKHLAEADGILYVAAVADYRPATTETEKRPKSKVGFELTLVPNPDLAATLNAEKSPDTFTVGFALQTQSGEDAARQKLQSKHLDGIVLNYADSMGSTSGHFSYLAKGAEDFLDWGALPKPEAARRILGELGGQDSVEVRVQRSECRGQSTEVRVQRSEYRGQSFSIRTKPNRLGPHLTSHP
jgi:phosphopantothenoylcysteine decarboxylase/phosphopantothenate--cysteine ligase